MGKPGFVSARRAQEDSELAFLDERTCDSPTCLKAARLRHAEPCGYEILLCARHRRVFDGWKGVTDDHGHVISTPTTWTFI